jgi:serine-type anaerobic sulfatase-maturating enzyme
MNAAFLAERDEAPNLRAFHVMTKPVGPICNLDCKYCFYLEKEKLYPANERFAMPDQVLEEYIRQHIESQSSAEISFAWQGGEPTLLGVRFFRKVVALQAKYAGGKTVRNALQTNGTLLDDEWGEFLRSYQFLVGLSIDGPRDLHDVYRVDKRQNPTFERVMAGLAVLKKHQVDFNTLTVVNCANSKQPLEVYRFLKEIGSSYIQFIPLVERTADQVGHANDRLLALPPTPGEAVARRPVTPWSVDARQYGNFLVEIFEEWVLHDVGRIFVQLFDVALGNWMGLGSSLCIFAEKCGAALALEHNGDVYSCDHYVYPQYQLGNILNKSLGSMVSSPEQRHFGREKFDSLPDYCRRCEVRFACHGECPKNRFIETPDGEPGLNYLCPAYKHFFKSIDPYMKTMAQLLNAHRAPAEIMDLLRKRDREIAQRTVRRNDPCPCGSGRKFKHCHLGRSPGGTLRS